MKLFLEQLPTEAIESLHFLRYDFRREEIRINAQERYILNSLAFDLLRLDFFTPLLHNCTELKEEFYNIKQKNIGEKLYTKSIQMLGLNLHLKRISEISFLLNLPDKIRYSSPQNKQNILLTSFPLPFESKNNISKKVAAELQSKYECFLRKWIPTPIFYFFYIFPSKKTLDIPDTEMSMWLAFKAELSLLFGSLNEYFTISESNNILYFWIFYLSKINNIRTFLTPNLLFEESLNDIQIFVDEQNDRINNSVDFLGTSFGMNFLYHYLDYSVYPISPKQKIEVSKENFDKDLYGRFSKVLYTQDSEKQELLVNSCTNPKIVPKEGLIKIFRYLYHYSGSHIKGYVGELFALPLLKLGLLEQLDDFVVIPGGAIQVNNLQGPDGLIARLHHDEQKGYCLQIGGIIEIKAKKTSKRQLFKQLQNHHNRLKETNAKVLLHLTGDETPTFISPTLYINPPSSQTITVAEITFLEKTDYYSIIPAIKKTPKTEDFGVIQLFWTEEGFNRMTFSFLKWTIENFGRIKDPNDYDIGINSWIYNLEILKSSEVLTKAERKLVANFYDFLKGEWQNPDDELSTIKRL